MEELDLAGISKKYGLPSVSYSTKLKPGDGTFDRTTGKILISESLRFASEPEVLRVAFRADGHFHTRSYAREKLPVHAAMGCFALLVLCIAVSDVRALIPSYVPFFGLALLIFTADNGRRLGEQAADRWAMQHWPDAFLKQGEAYF